MPKNYVDSLFDQIKSGKKTKKQDPGKAAKPEKQPTPIQTPPLAPNNPKKDYYAEIIRNVKKSNEQNAMRTPPLTPTQNTQPAQKQTQPQQPREVPQSVQELAKKITEVKAQLKPEVAVEEEAGPSKTEREFERTQKVEIDAYGEAKIYRVPGQELLYYWTPVVRPGGAEKAIINTIKEATTRIVSITPYKIRDPEQRRNFYYQKILEIIRDSPELNISKAKHEFYAEAVVREMIGYGIIDTLIKDDQLEEIMVIGPNIPVYIFHRKYEMMITNIEFFNDTEVQDLINRIARQIGRRVDIASPLLDARLPDGSRVNATIPPSTVAGSTLTIRKFREDPYTILELIKKGTINAQGAAFLWMCVEGLGVRPANILIAGGTGSGKTTTLNVLASFIPETERIITIEDTAELNLPLKHWIRMEARPPGLEGSGELTLDILTKNSLRMRPDRIIVGEIRHDEAFALFTAFNTGHDGCLTPDTKIALTNGIREIGEFTEEQIQKNGYLQEGEWQVSNVEGEFANSLDDKGKITKQKIVQARRKPFEGNIYHIKLASGSEITCTGNHPFYTFDNNLEQISAQDIREGQNIATPRKIVRDVNAKEAESEYWSGLLHGDGNLNLSKRIREKNGNKYICNDGSINLYTEEPQVLPKFIEYMKKNLQDTQVKIVYPRPEKQCYEVHISGVEKTNKAIQIFDMPHGNRQKTKMSNSHYTSELREFVAGFFDAEGHVDANNNAIVITCANENYIDFFRYALLTEGIISRKYESKSHNSRWYRLYIYGIAQVEKFYQTYPIKYPQKIAKIKELLKLGKKANTNVDVIDCNKTIKQMLEEAKKIGYGNCEIARRAKLTQGLISFYKKDERRPSRSALKTLAKAFESIGIDASRLNMLAQSDVFFDKVVAIHSYPYSGFVYDLTISETERSGKMPHNFVAQGIIVGNSLGTVHANSPQETIIRVTSPPMNVPEVMMSGLNFIIVQHRLHDKKLGTIRRVTEIAEVTGALKGKAKANTVFKWDAYTDSLKRSDETMEYMILLEDMTGISRKSLEDEMEKRAKFLTQLLKEDLKGMHAVSERMNDYIVSQKKS